MGVIKPPHACASTLAAGLYVQSKVFCGDMALFACYDDQRVRCSTENTPIILYAKWHARTVSQVTALSIRVTFLDPQVLGLTVFA